MHRMYALSTRKRWQAEINLASLEATEVRVSGSLLDSVNEKIFDSLGTSWCASNSI